jgi:ankyrin repeat protein
LDNHDGEQAPVKTMRRIVFNAKAGIASGLSAESIEKASAVMEHHARSRAALAAYRRRDHALLDRLLETDIDLNIKDNDGTCLLHYAVRVQDPAMVERLLRKGADIYATDANGNTPLLAAISRDTDCALLLIDADPDLSRHWKNGAHALHIGAAKYDGAQIVEKLLARGVDPQLKDANGDTPLAHALRRRQETAETLCFAGALKGLDAADIAALSALMAAEEEKHYHWDLAALMEKAAALDSAQLQSTFPAQDVGLGQQMRPLDAELFEALRHSSPCIGPLIDKGARLDARNAEGDTPLIYALKHNRDQYCIEYLLQKGSDVNAENKGGMTPLHYAVGIVEGVIARMLLDRGAWPDAQDKIYGRTPLMMACAKGGNHMDLLLKRGADPRLCDRMGWNGLDIAILHRNDWSKDKMEKALKKAETDPPKTIPKPVRRPPDDRYGSRWGYRPDFW